MNSSLLRVHAWHLVFWQTQLTARAPERGINALQRRNASSVSLRFSAAGFVRDFEQSQACGLHQVLRKMAAGNLLITRTELSLGADAGSAATLDSTYNGESLVGIVPCTVRRRS